MFKYYAASASELREIHEEKFPLYYIIKCSIPQLHTGVLSVMKGCNFNEDPTPSTTETKHAAANSVSTAENVNSNDNDIITDLYSIKIYRKF